MNNVLNNLCLIVIFVFAITSNSYSQTSCQDCPNSNYIYNPNAGIATLSSSIFVETTGPDDLSINPLSAVHINLQHGWLSDVYISLISPSGLHYVLMGDNNNQAGGCENPKVSYANIRIVPGNFNPLTEGTPFYLSCNGGFECLNGDFTLACNSSAIDLYNGGLPAPNCNLADYNQPGHSVSGVWTLLINCVCPHLEPAGGYPLLYWGLDFDIPTQVTGEEVTCLADGGTDYEFAYQRCQGESFHQNINTYAEDMFGQIIVDYSRSGLLIKNGVIFEQGPDYNQAGNLPEGVYEVAAITYHNPDDFEVVSDFVGKTVTELEAFLNENDMCYDWMEKTSTLEILPTTPPVYITKDMCKGECVKVFGNEYCEPGQYEINYAGPSMCEGETYLIYIYENDNSTAAELSSVFCLGEELKLQASGGKFYKWTGPNGFSSTDAAPSISVTSVADEGVYHAEITTNEGCKFNYELDFSTETCQEISMEETVEAGVSKMLCFDAIVGMREENMNSLPNFKYVLGDNCIRFSGAPELGTSELQLRVYKDGMPTYLNLIVNTIENDYRNEVQVNNEFKKDLSIFPNPSSDFIQIKSKKVLQHIQLLNVNGQPILNWKVNDFQTKLDLSEIPTGVYWLNMQTEEGLKIEKLIVF